MGFDVENPTLHKDSNWANDATCMSTSGMILINLWQEIGIEHPVLQIFTDSSSNVAALCRRGPGKIRNLNCKQLWLQQQMRDKIVQLHKVESSVNPADILTKHLNPKAFCKGCSAGSFGHWAQSAKCSPGSSCSG